MSPPNDLDPELIELHDLGGNVIAVMPRHTVIDQRAEDYMRECRTQDGAESFVMDWDDDAVEAFATVLRICAEEARSLDVADYERIGKRVFDLVARQAWRLVAKREVE